MRRWQATAAPIVATLQQAQDQVLVMMDEGSQTSLLAACDQLKAAAAYAEDFQYLNPCPDDQIDAHFERFFVACAGVATMLSTGLLTDPEYRQRVDDFLEDRIITAVRARAALIHHN